MSNLIIIKARRKIIALFDRNALERICTMPKPWLADTASLKANIEIAWPEAVIEAEIMTIMDRAK